MYLPFRAIIRSERLSLVPAIVPSANFPRFLLSLGMGISSGACIGFKVPEKNTAPQPVSPVK